MSSTNKTSLGLNMWEASDKPVRQDFVNDNVIIDDEVTKLKQDIGSNNTVINEKINKLNSNLSNYVLAQNVDISYSVPASSYVIVDYSPPNVAGYTAAFALPTWTGDNNATFIVTTLAGIRLRNLSTTAINSSARVTVVYKKNITV